jgi:L-rhamnose isomerase
VFPPLGLPFLFIAKVGTFKRQIKDYCSKIIRALSLYFIKIFIDFFDSHINTRFKEGVIFVLKALLNLLEDLIEELYISN